MTLRVLDLFSGIGGFSLGLERAGMRTVAFCEIEPFARRVLAKHWPEVPCYDDVRTLSADRLRGDGIAVDVICGGFPCQDISVAGRGAGLAGARSGLWAEYARLIRELRPRWVVIENVAALLGRGLDAVLWDLAAIRYDATWHCIPASSVGAPHRRDRIWIVGYPRSAAGERNAGGVSGSEAGERGEGQYDGYQPDGLGHAGADGRKGHVAHAHGGGRREQGDVGRPAGDAGSGQSECGGEGVADAYRTERTRGIGDEDTGGRTRSANGRAHVSLAGGKGFQIGPGTIGEWAQHATARGGVWDAVTGMGGEADGPPSGVDGVAAWEGNTPRTVGQKYPHRRQRLIALGNAVVPQIPEIIGLAILKAEDRLGRPR